MRGLVVSCMGILVSVAASFTRLYTDSWLPVPRLSMYDRLTPVLPPTVYAVCTHPPGPSVYSYIRNTHEIEHEIVLKCLAISSSSQISYFLRLMSLWTAPASSQCLNIQSTNVSIMMQIFRKSSSHI